MPQHDTPDLEVDVCIIGAGFAGLMAALRLHQAGTSVALLEARDRVGGRTFTQLLDDGTTYVDKGGTWVGPGQDAIYGLMKEFGVEEYKQHVEGENLMFLGGPAYRYTGTVPMNLNPWVTANVGGAFLWLTMRAKQIPVEAPWEAKHADRLDSETFAAWLRKPTTVGSKQARDLLATAVGGLYTSDPSELSVLYVLYQMASCGGPSFVLGVEHGAEDARSVGGMRSIYEPMATALDGSIHLSQPVRRIAQNDDGVTVTSDSMNVRARRAIVAVPIGIASHISYEPMLPMDRAFLHQRSPMGAVIKVAAIYEEPFWRADGLSGESVGTGSAVSLTIDASTHTGTPGILNAFVNGPPARELTQLDEARRREIVIDELVHRFGTKARATIGYIEKNWTIEPYTGGGMIAHFPPGVLTSFGPALRAPCGRIHWAGSESSAVMMGMIDGAVRSGERAAKEVLALGD